VEHSPNHGSLSAADAMDLNDSEQIERLTPRVSEETSDFGEHVASQRRRNIFFRRFGGVARVAEQNRNQRPVAASRMRFIEGGQQNRPQNRKIRASTAPALEFSNIFQVHDLFDLYFMQHFSSF
jgi:hypothetical protein